MLKKKPRVASFDVTEPPRKPKLKVVSDFDLTDKKKSKGDLNDVPKKRSRSLPGTDEEPPRDKPKKKKAPSGKMPFPERREMKPLRLHEDDDEDEAPRKKKPSFELVVPEGKGPKRISKLSGKLQSIIGDDAENIMQSLEVGNIDNGLALLNRRLIQTVVDLIPKLETGIRESNGRYGVHSFNGLIQTVRELVIDLQQAQDRGAIGQAIVERILQPAFLEMATLIVEEQATVLSEVKADLSPEDYAKLRTAQIDSRTRIAAFMQSKFSAVKDETISYLQK
jgi:hypothetical protein